MDSEYVPIKKKVQNVFQPFFIFGIALRIACVDISLGMVIDRSLVFPFESNYIR